MSKATEAIDEVEAAAAGLSFDTLEWLRAEIHHRTERRRAEHRIREADPKITSAALELLIEADAVYKKAQDRWVTAQTRRQQSQGTLEVAKLRAWLLVRSVK